MRNGDNNTGPRSLTHPPLPCLPLPGHRLVVTATGPDEHGTDSVALWWTGPSGEPMAGWLFPARAAYEDPATARRLLVAAAGGLLVDRATGAGAALLDRLADRAGPPWQAATPRSVLDLDQLVADVERRLGTEGRPGTERRRHTVRPAPRRSDCPVVDEVLGTGDLIAWCVQGWRVAAGADGGPASPLPTYRGRQARAAASMSTRALLGLSG